MSGKEGWEGGEGGDREGGRGGGGERERAYEKLGPAGQTRERKDEEGACIWMQSVTG